MVRARRGLPIMIVTVGLVSTLCVAVRTRELGRSEGVIIAQTLARPDGHVITVRLHSEN